MGKMNKFAFKNYSPIFTAFFERRAVLRCDFCVESGKVRKKEKAPKITGQKSCVFYNFKRFYLM